MWEDKDGRRLVVVLCARMMLKACLKCVCSGEKLKEIFLKTGSFQEVENQVKRWTEIRQQKESTAKPVTKTQLKNMYHYDECLAYIHACI